MALIDVTTAKSMENSDPRTETGRLHECIQLRFSSPDDIPDTLKQNSYFDAKFGRRSITPIAEGSKLKSSVFVQNERSDQPETTMIFEKTLIGNKGAPVFTTEDYEGIGGFLQSHGVADAEILRPAKIETQMRATAGLSNTSSVHNIDYFATQYSGLHSFGYKEHTVPAERYRNDAARVAGQANEQDTAGDAQAREAAATVHARSIARRHGVNAQTSQFR